MGQLFVTAFGYKMKAQRVCYPTGWFRTPAQRAEARAQFVKEIGEPEPGNLPLPSHHIPILKKQYQQTGLCSGWNWKEKYIPDVKKSDYGAADQLIEAICRVGLKRVEQKVETRDPIEAFRLDHPIEYKLDIVRRAKVDRIVDEIAGWLLIPVVAVAAYFIYLLITPPR